MDYLSETKTLEERDLLLSEIMSVKRKDFGSVRKSFLDNYASIDLTDLNSKLKSLEVIRILIAIEPTIDILNMIEEFFKTNLDKKVIFDFEIDRSMLSGIKIIYKGKYFDFSI